MNIDFDKIAVQFKAMSDPNRLRIIEMLSCGELCGCELLEKLHITQPTLSYHMNILSEVKLVTNRKEGKNTFYKIDKQKYIELGQFLSNIDSADCSCR